MELTILLLLLLLLTLLFCLFLWKALAHTLVSAVELKRILVCDLFGLPLCLSFNLSVSALSVFSLCSSCLSYLSVHTHKHDNTNTKGFQRCLRHCVVVVVWCCGCVSVLWFVLVCCGGVSWLCESNDGELCPRRAKSGKTLVGALGITDVQIVHAYLGFGAKTNRTL